MGFLFEKLEVYQRAVGFGEKILALTECLPRGQNALADQLKRAAVSISLNIAEGNGRWHPKERKNFFLIARGSVFECVPILELCRRQGWIEQEAKEILRSELEVIGKMLSALIKQADTRLAKS